jgi:hypothetical protein
MDACDRAKIDPEQKYKDAKSKLTKLNRKPEAITETVNRKMASQMILNQKLYGNSDMNYTVICENLMDESIMTEYKTQKQFINQD